MKKFIVTIAIVLLLVALCAPSWAGSSRSIGNTADAAITAGSGILTSIVFHTDGTNSVTAAIYDNATAASGSKIISTPTITTSSSNRVTVITFDRDEGFYANGIYVDVTTSGTVTYDVYFETR